MTQWALLMLTWLGQATSAVKRGRLAPLFTPSLARAIFAPNAVAASSGKEVRLVPTLAASLALRSSAPQGDVAAPRLAASQLFAATLVGAEVALAASAM